MLELIKFIVVSPGILFKSIEKYERDIRIIFTIGFVVVFAKSLFKEGQAVVVFEDKMLDGMLSVLTTPYVQVMITYMSFFAFVFLLFLLLRRHSSKARLRPLLLSFMSLAVIGLLAQIISIPISFLSNQFVSIPINFLSNQFMLAVGYLCYFWTIALALLSIRENQGVSLKRASLSYFLIAAPFFLLIGLLVVSPSLLYLRGSGR